MDKLKPLICPNCGGQINRVTYICEYCGTKFKEESSNILRIEVGQPGIHTLTACIGIDESIATSLGLQETAELALKDLSNQLAECMAPFIEIQMSDTLRTDNIMQIRGKVRIVDPKYRF